jgi:hypothetical protein
VLLSVIVCVCFQTIILETNIKITLIVQTVSFIVSPITPAVKRGVTADAGFPRYKSVMVGER